MKSDSFTTLIDALEHLERAISDAKRVALQAAPPRLDVIERLSGYDSVLAKQRSSAEDLLSHASSGDWSKVVREIKVINGLSRMIRDDVLELLPTGKGVSNDSSKEKESFLQ